MSRWFKDYGKSIAAVVFALIFAIQSAIFDGHVSTVEGVQIVIAVATAAGVYLVPLHPAWLWSKTAVGVLLAVLNVAVTLIMAGWRAADWTDLILAALTAVGVAATPARPLPLPSAHAAVPPAAGGSK
jgi:hypothetical protein